MLLQIQYQVFKLGRFSKERELNQWRSMGSLWFQHIRMTKVYRISSNRTSHHTQTVAGRQTLRKKNRASGGSVGGNTVLVVQYNENNIQIPAALEPRMLFSRMWSLIRFCSNLK